MLFNSLAYFLLINVVRVFQIFVKTPAIFMLGGSLVFYLFSGLFDTSVFIISLVLNWLICKFLPTNKIRIIVAVLFNIGLLITFKYMDFLMGANKSNLRAYIDIALPLGISFYTFQILAYQIDVARGISKEASSFKSFALFIAFFPQLIAGPIVRSKELLPQIERLFKGKKKKVRLISYGIALFLLGIFKKVIIADSIAPFVDEIFFFGPENMAWAWLANVLFGFQIYCDFSGYSDMAIGSAYLLGIKLPTNFKTPFLSKGPREFWQRWHITFSTWIRDYVYIPLGGNHGTLIKAGFVVVFTMATAGLWHGADMTFVLWGAAWGFYIFLGRICKWIKLPSVLAIASHFTITVFLWVLFRAPNLDTAINYYQIMLGLKDGIKSPATFYEQTKVFPVLVSTSIALYFLHIAEHKIHNIRSVKILKRFDGPFMWGLLLGIIILLILLPNSDSNPFIYFRF